MPAADAIADLASLRVDAAGLPPAPEEARRQVRALAESHYENFSVLSRLVPAGLRDDFAAVYAFCRWSDDLADETGAGAAARARSLDLLARWRGQLIRCFDWSRGIGEPPAHSVFIALSETIRRHALPPDPFHHLLDAFEQDQRVSRYETWEQVLDYCTRSANPVGRIILMLDGRRPESPGDAELFRMSDATCTALQLTNFWQDVRRDLLERDRVYMPSAETGVDAEMLREWADRSGDAHARVAFIRALRPLVDRTWDLFRAGRALPREMSSALSPVVWLFGAGGESVLRAVERIGCATLWDRPTLTRPRKLLLVASAFMMRRLGVFGRGRSG